MKTIILDKAKHHGTEVVLIKFPIDQQLGTMVRKLPNARWSKTYTAWHVPYSVMMLHKIKEVFDPFCKIDASPLKEKVLKYHADPKNKELNNETVSKIEKYMDWMRSRRYSESTIGTYTDALRTFLKFFHNKKVENIANDDVIRFNNRYILANNYSATFQNQVV